MKLTPMQEWFSGRSIFITGATGFMGKVLLEKMMRDLPTIAKIYIMVRPKRNLTPAQRLESITKLAVFDRLRLVNPEALTKLQVVEGCLTDDNFGLSEANLLLLTNEVSVVYHMAATLRLEAGIKEAILPNTLGTVRMMELCKKMKNIESVVHLSTAFCHCDIDVMEEKVYKPDHDPYDMIKLSQIASDDLLNSRKEELIAPHPNAYTFSKRLAEWVVKDYETMLPVAIARPSIVLPAMKEPTPGWVDNLNGPVGVIIASGKGVLRSMLCNEKYNAECVPVDIAINALIVAAYDRGNSRDKKLMVYNITSPRDVIDITWGEVINRGRNIMHEYPFEWILWYPDGNIRTNVLVHWLILVLFQWLPALLLDTIFFILRRETFMIRVQKKIYVGLQVLQHFTLHNWDFRTDHIMSKLRALSPGDREIFYTDNVQFELDAYLSTIVIGARKYCLKEDLSTLPYWRAHLKVLYVLHKFCIFGFYYLLAWYTLNLFGAADVISLEYWFAENEYIMGVRTL